MAEGGAARGWSIAARHNAGTLVGTGLLAGGAWMAWGPGYGLFAAGAAVFLSTLFATCVAALAKARG